MLGAAGSEASSEVVWASWLLALASVDLAGLGLRTTAVSSEEVATDVEVAAGVRTVVAALTAAPRPADLLAAPDDATGTPDLTPALAVPAAVFRTLPA